MSIRDISTEEFKLFQDLVYRQSGILLGEQKRILLMTRLQKLLRDQGLSSFQEYYNNIISDPSSQMLNELIDAISTNHTFFLREKSHFDFLSTTVLPEITGKLRQQGDKNFRLWCAASSSGEEPYGLAMTLLDFLNTTHEPWKAGILATDISRDILDTASQGVYEKEKLKDLPSSWRQKYFKDHTADTMIAAKELKDTITFRRFNLLNPLPFKRSFHVVFCRNVMIYFDDKTVQNVVEKIYDFVVPGGYLFVGHSESLGRINTRFEHIKPAIYQRKT